MRLDDTVPPSWSAALMLVMRVTFGALVPELAAVEAHGQYVEHDFMSVPRACAEVANRAGEELSWGVNVAEYDPAVHADNVCALMWYAGQGQQRAAVALGNQMGKLIQTTRKVNNPNRWYPDLRQVPKAVRSRVPDHVLMLPQSMRDAGLTVHRLGLEFIYAKSRHPNGEVVFKVLIRSYIRRATDRPWAYLDDGRRNWYFEAVAYTDGEPNAVLIVETERGEKVLWLADMTTILERTFSDECLGNEDVLKTFREWSGDIYAVVEELPEQCREGLRQP